MSNNNKVIWSEGMFLKPQHFQQTDRYLEYLTVNRPTALFPYDWGLITFEIDEKLLAFGKFALLNCRGFFRDGTSFDIPSEDISPIPLEVPLGANNVLVYLALPLKRYGVLETTSDEDKEAYYRYRSQPRDISSSHENDAGTVATVQTGGLCLSLRLEKEDLSGYTVIPIARVKECREDQLIILDNNFIPPCLDVHAIPNLVRVLTELRASLRHRSQSLAKLMTSTGYGGTAEIAEFLMLQITRRYEVYFEHLINRVRLHPEQLYLGLLELLNELNTFDRKRAHTIEYTPYYHEDLQKSIHSILIELRVALNKVLEQTAILLDLKKQSLGISVAVLPTKELIETADFVLAVKAGVPSETIRNHLPRQIKVASAEEISELINRALPGITIKPLPVAPREIPFNAGFTYFSLDKTNKNWSKLKDKESIAVHIAGDYPGLQLELWAINQR